MQALVTGGYPVIKKRLSCRGEAILGRPLIKEKAREVTATIMSADCAGVDDAELDGTMRRIGTTLMSSR